MKKTLFLTLVALLLLCSAAFATPTRVMTLGETNNILLDEANIWLYPSRINMYPNVAGAEVDWSGADGPSSFMQAFGIHWKFGEKNPWVLGTYFYNYGAQSANGGYGDNLALSNTFLPMWYPAPDLTGWYDDPQFLSNKRLTLFYGRKLGNNPFGFYLNLVHASNKEETVGDEFTESVHEYDFGFGFTDANGKWDFAAGLNTFGWTDKVDATYYNTKPKGNMSFWVNGRMFKQNGPWTLVPNAGFIFGKYQADFYGGDATMDRSEKWNVFSAFFGLGAHYTPVANVLAVGEAGLALGSFKFTNTPTVGAATEDKNTFLTLPYFKMGLEGKVFDWLDARFGSVSYWQRESSELGTYKEKWNYPDNYIYLGTGMHFGNLHIDTYSNPQILLNGFNFISGAAAELNWGVSLLYEFK